MTANGGDRGGLFQTGGRFAEGVDALMQRFNDSIPIDQRLYDNDLDGSAAYADSLEQLRLITSAENTTIQDGIKTVRKRWRDGTFKLQSGDEDIHTANERQLSDEIGSHVAGKLHTGRSRNDQVAVDFRLWYGGKNANKGATNYFVIR